MRRRLVIADDHAVVVEGLQSLLAGYFEVVATVTNPLELRALVRRTEPDVLLLDFSMPGVSGLEQIREISELPRPPGIVILTMHDDPILAHEVIRAGAFGFLPKTSPIATVVEALNFAGEGTPYANAPDAASVTAARAPGAGPADEPIRHLTARQAVVVEMLAAGHSTKRIAVELGLSRRTVETHKYQAMRILSVSNLAGLIRVAILGGLQPPRDDLWSRS